MGIGKIPAGWLWLNNSADRNYGKCKLTRNRMVRRRKDEKEIERRKIIKIRRRHVLLSTRLRVRRNRSGAEP
jgi:hypothetical protein